MAYDDLNKFILDYLNYDISGRAIMLTSEWGSGKSYYVKEKLKSFLEEKEKKCVIVSLYGLSDVSEIGKAIFLELHPVIKKLSAARDAGRIIGKTLLNGLASKIGFDLENPNDEMINKMYDSIDLSGTLVVLEDIERTQIEITRLLGYVNNLCENDRVKILLITNEDELLETYEGKDGEGKKVRYYTESASKYKRIKEKTVGDTIHFVCDIDTAIREIIARFGHNLSWCNDDEIIEEVCRCFKQLNSYNLRAFIYGCQKSRNLFEIIADNKIELNNKIKGIIFYGIIGFTQRQSKDSNLRFDSDFYLSGKLGVNESLPLFRFCYEYIVFQTESIGEIKSALKYYTDYMKKGKWNSGKDEDLLILKDFYVRAEDEVVEALSNIPKKINDGTIPYYDYGVIANFVVAIKYEAEIDFDIETIINAIIDGLRSLNVNIEFESLFSSGFELKNEKGLEYFEHIKQRMKEAITGIDKNFEFIYKPSALMDYYKKLDQSSADLIRRHGFAHKLDIQRVIDMLKQCSPEEIGIFRSLFMELYRFEHYSRVLEEDIKALIAIRDAASKLVKYDGYHKIQKMQLKWFINNLSDIILAFEKQKDN